MASSSSEWTVSSLDENTNYIASPATVEGSNSEHETTTTPSRKKVPTRLFLHFDVNETILLGDAAGGDSFNESAQKMLAKSAFCRIPGGSQLQSLPSPPLSWETTTKHVRPTHWWDGQEIGRETSVPKLYTGWEWPEGCCPYYRTAYKRRARSFAEDGSDGAVYQPVLEACEKALRSSSSSSNTVRTRSSRDAPGEASSGKDRRTRDRNDTILPAFYETLRHLIATSRDQDDSKGSDQQQQQQQQQQRPSSSPFSVVFRTFGSDLPEIASVVTAFAKGEHPDYPDVDFPPLCLSKDRLYQGRWKVITASANTNGDGDVATTTNEAAAMATPKAKVIYQLWNYFDETELVASGDAEILELLSGGHTTNNEGDEELTSPQVAIFGIRDDYNFWKSNGFYPTAGKPIWVPDYNNNSSSSNEHSSTTNAIYDHHLLFDDNIHNLPDDGIACIRKESKTNTSSLDGGTATTTAAALSSSSSFETVDGTNMESYHGVHLVRVPTVEPVLDPHWYIRQIENARNRLQLRLQSESN